MPWDEAPSPTPECALESLRERELQQGLEPWLEESRKRPAVVDSEWMDEICQAYIDAQIEFERLQRYAIGRGLLAGLPGYYQDPVIQRHEVRVTRRRDHLRFYLAELIIELRKAEAEGRFRPARGHRTRRAWWDQGQQASERKTQGSGASSKRKGASRGATRRKRKRKLYGSKRVRSLIEERRRKPRKPRHPPC